MKKITHPFHAFALAIAMAQGRVRARRVPASRATSSTPASQRGDGVLTVYDKANLDAAAAKRARRAQKRKGTQP